MVPGQQGHLRGSLPQTLFGAVVDIETGVFLGEEVDLEALVETFPRKSEL